jgi:penicillin-binding protein 2
MDLRQRLGTLLIVMMCLFGTLFARVAWLQTVERQTLENASEQNTKEVRVVPTARGRILDRNGNVLVDNKVVSVVMVKESLLPPRTAARAGVFERLQPILGIEATELKRRFESVDDLEGVEVARNVSESAVVYLNENRSLFPGVFTIQDSQRVYPQGKLAPHVIGYVGDIGDDLLPDRQPCNARYETGDKVGKAGVERSYECILRGMPGKVEYTVDRKNNITAERWIALPQPGVDVRLTIDPDVQREVERRLRQGLLTARQNKNRVFLPGVKASTIPFTFHKAPAGAAVVYDAETGAIVAMASYPDYDPSDFVGGISVKDFEAKYGGEGTNAPLTNRAISGQYAPGSTMKPFGAVAAFNDGLINERTTISDEGSFTIPNCPKNVKCRFQNAGGFANGPVDVERSLVVSSDVFYYLLGYRYATEPSWPRNGMQDTYKMFGFGGDTRVALPNEKAGRVPTPELYEEQAKATGSNLKWRTGDNLNMAIGQGEMLATPLQLAVGYGPLVNPGQLLVPRIAFDTPPPLEPTEVGPGQDAKQLAELADIPGGSVTSGRSGGSSSTSSPGAPPPGSTGSTSPPSPSSSSSSSETSTSVRSSPGVGVGPRAVPVDLRRSGSGGGRFGVEPPDSTVAEEEVGQPAEPSPDTPPEPDNDTEGDAGGSGSGTSDSGGDDNAAGDDPGDPEIRPLAPYERLAVSPVGVVLTPKLQRSVDLSEDVRIPVLNGLRGVVRSDQGTAYKPFEFFPLRSFPVGGKTGTAQVVRKHDTSLFVGFGGPNERFIVAVVLEEAGFGGSAAAPVARRIFEGLNGVDGGEVNYVIDGSRDR